MEKAFATFERKREREREREHVMYKSKRTFACGSELVSLKTHLRIASAALPEIAVGRYKKP